MNEQILNVLVKALEFYANGENERVIYNRQVSDKTTHELMDKGFTFEHEAYNGDQYYIEDGRTAREALAELEKYIEGRKMNEQKLTYDEWRLRNTVVISDEVRQALKEYNNINADAEVERAMRKEYEFYLNSDVEGER